MERITERDKLQSLLTNKLGETAARAMMVPVLTCQEYAKGTCIIIIGKRRKACHLLVIDTEASPVYWVGDVSIPFSGTFEECNALMTEITK